MKRKLLVLTLTLMLVVSMAVPAFAASASGSYGGGNYTCTLITNKDKSTATMTYSLVPFTLHIYARNKVTIQPSGDTVWGDKVHYSGTSPVSGTVNNYIYDNASGTIYYGEVRQGQCDYYVGSDGIRILNAYT